MEGRTRKEEEGRKGCPAQGNGNRGLKVLWTHVHETRVCSAGLDWEVRMRPAQEAAGAGPGGSPRGRGSLKGPGSALNTALEFGEGPRALLPYGGPPLCQAPLKAFSGHPPVTS